jgi:hypothetical protein
MAGAVAARFTTPQTTGFVYRSKDLHRKRTCRKGSVDLFGIAPLWNQSLLPISGFSRAAELSNFRDASLKQKVSFD